jgi:hypothetical protein
VQTIFIQTSPALWPIVEAELDIAQKELDAGNRVIFSYCDGNEVSCEANNPLPNQKIKKRYCLECQSRRMNSFKWLQPKAGELIYCPYSMVEKSDLLEIKILIDKFHENRNSAEAMMSTSGIIGGEIYEAALSTLMTSLRESNPDIFRHWKKFSLYLESGLRALYSAKIQMKKWNPDLVYIYNGRMTWYRPLLWLSKKEEIQFIVYEYPVFGHERYLTYLNTHAHDVASQAEVLRVLTENPNLEISEILKVGGAWFENRINRKSMGFEPIYAGAQQRDRLPDGWDPKRFNISFFVSSQDEMNMLEQGSNSLALGQIGVIEGIGDEFPDIFIYVRIHPNLKGVDSAFVQELINLERHRSNIKVIKAESAVDTYGLVKNSNLVVSCGSTVGVEAAYLGIHSLVIGASFYGELKCAAQANSQSELHDLISALIKGEFNRFPSREHAFLGACKYGWAVVNQGVKPEYFRKNTYLNGSMIRGELETRITAKPVIIIINRILDLPYSLYLAYRKFRKNPLNLQAFFQSPVTSIKKIFFSDYPKRY